MRKALVGFVKESVQSGICGYFIFDADTLGYMCDKKVSDCSNVLMSADFNTYREQTVLDKARSKYPHINFITTDGNLLDLPVYVLQDGNLKCVENEGTYVIVAEEVGKGYYILGTDLKLYRMGYADCSEWYRRFEFYNYNPALIKNKYLYNIPCRKDADCEEIQEIRQKWGTLEHNLSEASEILNMSDADKISAMTAFTEGIASKGVSLLSNYNIRYDEWNKKLTIANINEFNYLFNTCKDSDKSISISEVIPKLNSVVFHERLRYRKIPPNGRHIFIHNGALNCVSMDYVAYGSCTNIHFPKTVGKRVRVHSDSSVWSAAYGN